MRENRATTALLRVIPQAFNPVAHGDMVRLTRGPLSWSMKPLWLGEGFPADVHRMLARLDTIRPTRGEHPVTRGEHGPFPVLVARRMSPGAQELLDAHEISWVDTAGRAVIAIEGELYISRLPPIASDAGRPFSWSAAAAVVAEWMLTRAARLPEADRLTVERVTVIAKATDLSSAHVARVLRQFDEQHYTIKTGAERGSSASREFRDAGRMLSDWAANHSLNLGRRAIEFTVPWRDPNRTIDQVRSALGGLAWALTGAAAADLIAPHLTSVPTVDVYVSEAHERDSLKILSAQDHFTEVPTGGRVRLFTERAQALELSSDRDGVPVASPVRVYADLLREGGRAMEAAEFLRESAIGF